MIAGKLKNIIHSKKIRRSLLNGRLSREGNSGKIGLIIDDEKFESGQKLIELYKFPGINKIDFKVVFCGNSDKIPENLEADVLTIKDISLLGDFKTESIRRFASEDFDFLICYFSENNTAGYLLAAESLANIKIGNSPDSYGIFDVEIHAKKIDVFQQEVLKYLKILKKNN